MIDHTLDIEKLGDETSENAKAHDELMRNINYMIEEGVLEYIVDDQGQIHLFAAQGV